METTSFSSKKARAQAKPSLLREPLPHESRYALALIRSIVETLPDPGFLSQKYGPDALTMVWVSFAPTKNWKHWIPVQIWLGHLLELLFDPLDKEKDELPLFMPGRLTGPEKGKIIQRVQPNVSMLSLCVLDYDKGDAPFEVLTARVRELGFSALVYRSPSDGKNTTNLRRLGKTGKTLCEPTAEACRQKLIADGFKPEILGDVEIINDCYVDEHGAVWITVRHNPIAKTRLVAPLHSTAVRRPGESSRDFAQRWRRYALEPLAHAIGFVADTSRFDTNGAFYFPRLLDGVVTEYVGGATLDLDSDQFLEWQEAWVEPRRARDARRVALAAERRAVAEASGDAQFIEKRYALADLVWALANDRIRADRRDQKDGLIECECPFDELHSNAGDENDRGFYVTNGGAAGCLHSHKDDHCLSDYIAKMLADSWFSADQLEAYELPPNIYSCNPEDDLYSLAHGI